MPFTEKISYEDFQRPSFTIKNSLLVYGAFKVFSHVYARLHITLRNNFAKFYLFCTRTYYKGDRLKKKKKKVVFGCLWSSEEKT